MWVNVLVGTERKVDLRLHGEWTTGLEREKYLGVWFNIVWE